MLRIREGHGCFWVFSATDKAVPPCNKMIIRKVVKLDLNRGRRIVPVFKYGDRQDSVLVSRKVIGHGCLSVT